MTKEEIIKEFRERFVVCYKEKGEPRFCSACVKGIEQFWLSKLETHNQELLEKAVDAFIQWYSDAWANEEISEKGGVGLREKFAGDFLREFKQLLK